MSRTIILFASSRSQGNTRVIADYLARQLPADMLILPELSISYYDYQHKNRGDDFLPAFEQLVNYDTLLFVTPVYWYSMCAQMKTFIDRMSDVITIRKDLGRRMTHKRLAAVCCSSDAEAYPGFFMPFERTAGYFDMHYLGDCHTWLKDGQPAAAARRNLGELMDTVRSFRV